MDNELSRNKVVTGMKEILIKGHWVWAAPRGYEDLNKGRATERNLVVNEDGQILKKAFEWNAYNQLLNVEIARRFTRLGLDISEKWLNYILKSVLLWPYHQQNASGTSYRRPT